MEQIDRKKDEIIRSETALAAKPGYHSRIYYGWIVLVASVLIVMPFGPVTLSFSLFQAPILDEFHWSRESLATAQGIHFILAGIATPFAGGLVDRFGARRVMPIGALVTALGLILMSRSSAPWHFYIAYGLIAAAGTSLVQLVPLTTILTKWFARYRGMAIGIGNAGSGVGQAVLEGSLKLLIDRIAWRRTLLAYGLMILALPITLIWLFLYNRPEDRGLSIEDESGWRGKPGAKTETDGGEPDRSKPSKRRIDIVILDKKWAEVDWTVRKAARKFRFWALALAMTMYALGSITIAFQLPTYLKDVGYDSLIASALSFQGVLNIVGGFLGGILCDRIGREKTMTVSVVSFCAGIVLLNLAGTGGSPVIVYVFSVFYAIAQGIATPTVMISASDLFQGKHFGSIVGVIFLGAYFGAAIGAVLSGSLFDLTGAYQASFLVSALVLLISAALIWKARPGSVRRAQISQIRA
jgi:MFS family permease